MDELFLGAANFDKDWPSGRGIFISDDLKLNVKVNNVDHLEIAYEQSREPIYKEDDGVIDA